MIRKVDTGRFTEERRGLSCLETVVIVFLIGLATMGLVIIDLIVAEATPARLVVAAALVLGLVAFIVVVGKAVLGNSSARRRFYFTDGRARTQAYLTQEQYDAVLTLQKTMPVSVMRDQQTGRQWWMFDDTFWYDDEGLTAEAVRALVLDQALRKRKRIERAMARVATHLAAAGADEPAGGTGRREAIPDEVRQFVWQRDGGRCVRCGSQRNLEFDHIIPVSKGGSNSARNLQLLCEACNRQKGADLC